MIRRHSEEEDSYLKDFKQGDICLLSVADHCLSSENYVNVIVCDKQSTFNSSAWIRPSLIAQRALLKGSFQYRALYLGEPHPS
jgi:hypothetical protein